MRLQAYRAATTNSGYTDVQSHLREMNARNIDTVLEIMKRHPPYRFNLETSWLARNYMELRTPAAVNEMLARARSGRLGISALYLNLLTGLCSGEELHRALYFAASLSRNHNVPESTASSSDVASHSWFLPSLFANAGIIGFAAALNQDRSGLLINGPLGNDSPFIWQGADGSEVIAFFARHYHQIQSLVDDV